MCMRGSKSDLELEFGIVDVEGGGEGRRTADDVVETRREKRSCLCQP